jgi:IS30 family transposase
MAGTPLTIHEREEIRVGLASKMSCAAIARSLGRDPSTVSREVRRNGRARRYEAVTAQLHTDKRRRRAKIPKLIADRSMAAVVERELHLGFSPAAIAVRLALAGGPTVTAETIYQALYSKTFRGLKVLSSKCLRTRRPRRRARIRSRAISLVRQEWKLIDARPAGAAERTEPGHWEGDLIVGPCSRSAILTLVERTSRFILLARLPRTHDSFEVVAALIGVFETVPRHLRRSLTWDQGGEMSRWRHLEMVLDLPVFFCHPHSPWQRPSNENTNRQLRYWFPKGADLRSYDQAALDRATNVLNNQPRRLFGWETSAQRYGELAMR